MISAHMEHNRAVQQLANWTSRSWFNRFLMGIPLFAAAYVLVLLLLRYLLHWDFPLHSVIIGILVCAAVNARMAQGKPLNQNK
jgi:hypothetical protein